MRFQNDGEGIMEACAMIETDTDIDDESNDFD